MITAVFDLDRTLLPGTTAERIFLRYLIRRRLIGPSAAVRTALYGFQIGLRSAVQQIRADRPYLLGLHDATLRLHGRRCAFADIRPLLSARGVQRVADHIHCGHRLVLLSGSLPYVVEPLADELGIDDVICSRLEIDQLRLTGRLAGLHPYGEAKAVLMREYASFHNVDLSASYCYADHHTDESMLELFGNPVCVNPSEKLQRVAECRGWAVEMFGSSGEPDGGS
jgi:putative phosphoserine phosphatase / 1-acylglycerol-3-phosphate O-acyltransferase